MESDSHPPKTHRQTQRGGETDIQREMERGNVRWKELRDTEKKLDGRKRGRVGVGVGVSQAEGQGRSGGEEENTLLKSTLLFQNINHIT